MYHIDAVSNTETSYYLEDMPLQKSNLKTSAIVLSIVFFIVILFYVFRGTILTEMGKFLVVNDTLEPSDIIFVLTGGESRPLHAADLYKQGFAPKIVIPHIVIPQSELPPQVQFGIYPSQGRVYIGILHNLGIPDSVIQIADFPQGVSSTQDEAMALKEYVNQHSIKSVIIVTDAFHTRRARYIFQKGLQEESIKLMMYAVSHNKFEETNWWKFERGLIYCNNEYLKFIHYLLF